MEELENQSTMAPPNVDSPGKVDTSYHQVPTSEDEVTECKCAKQLNEISDSNVATPINECEKLVKEDDEEESSSDACSDEAEVVVPPDGGWGWVIVAASFMCNMIVDGIIFSFGTFLEYIADDFSATIPEVTLVGSLMSGFYLIAGPFASAIANRYGFRLVAILGSLMGATAFAVSYYSTSVTFLCISYGVLGGIGFGFIYVPSVITIGFYFERWRALATGIAVCGSGIGTFLFAPLSEALITNLGWRSALLCQGALVLSCIIYGALFRPLKPTKVKELDDKEEKPELIMDPTKLPLAARLKMEEAINSMRRNSTISTHDNQSSIPRLFGVNNNSEYPRVSDVYHTISIPSRKRADTYSKEKEKTLSVPFLADKGKTKEEGKTHLLELNKLNPIIVPRRSRTVSENQQESEVNRPLYRDDIFFGASLTRLPQYTSRTSVAYNLSVIRLPTKNDIEEEKKHSCKLCPEAFRRALATMLDFSLLKSPSFLILAVGGFFTMMGFYVPFMFLVDRAKTSGMTSVLAVWLVSSIGIANTVGRVLCGIVSSLPGVNALVLTNVALTIGGVATIFSGLSLTPQYQFFYTVVFGLAIACFASLRSIVVVDLLGLEKLTNAFGLLLLFQGVAAIIGAPLAGAFKNATGSYDASFYLSGGMLLASAMMCYPLNWVNQWERRRNEKSNKEVPV
ncbi:monocarboxylate transporter 7 isoform X1 [Anoplophora glabripennis]|nr:monocarboxylate transporter 7 isoform X1 [Anoplophora glabripennis]